MAELAAGQHVDDKVDRRVEDGHEVAHRRVVVVPAAAPALQVDERPDDAVNKSRRLTCDEDEDDDNQETVRLSLVRKRRVLSSSV